MVPSPWERKSAITREYQDAFTKQKPGQEFSYGSLEGYLTAKALVMALRLAGPNPTREGFVRNLHAAGALASVANYFSDASHFSDDWRAEVLDFVCQLETGPSSPC